MCKFPGFYGKIEHARIACRIPGPFYFSPSKGPEYEANMLDTNLQQINDN